MLKIRRGNTVLRIENDTLDYYMGQGFSLIDEAGNVIKKAEPVTKEELHRAYVENTATIKALNAEIEELKAEIEELKKPKKTPAKTTSKKK